MRAVRWCSSSDFCDEIAGASETSFARVYEGNPQSRMIGQTKNLTILADFSPLTLGHILVLSKFHYTNFAQVASMHLDELENLLELLTPQYIQTFGKLAVLEHGSASYMVGGACITHAHLHLLPLAKHDIDDKIASDGLEGTSFASLREFSGSPWSEKAYYLSGIAPDVRIYEPTRELPRQYLRSVAGQIIGISDPEWDWAVVVRKELLRETLVRTSGWTLQLTN